MKVEKPAKANAMGTMKIPKINSSLNNKVLHVMENFGIKIMQSQFSLKKVHSYYRKFIFD